MPISSQEEFKAFLRYASRFREFVKLYASTLKFLREDLHKFGGTLNGHMRLLSFPIVAFTA